MSNTNLTSEAAATLGSISTEKKAEAARANGRKGGRPRSTGVKLSATQEDALLTLDEYTHLTPFAALMHVGRLHRMTLAVLERNGFTRWYPYGADGEGCWKITADGRKWLDLYKSEPVAESLT